MKQRLFVLLILVFVLSGTLIANAQSAWAPNTAYSVGQLVTYGGSTYRCIQAHTSQVGWEPPNVASLWTLQTGGATATPIPATATRTNTPTGATATRTNTPVPTTGGNNGSPYNGTAISIPGTVQVENYNTGGQGI